MQHSGTARNSMATYITGLIDVGSKGNGKLIFRNTTGNPVATLTFSNPAFGAPNNGMATANPITPDVNALGGTIIRATAEDSDGNQIFICTVSYQAAAGIFNSA